MKVATSLAEKGYFYGISALVNSMIKNGTYFDKLIIGYRGILPSWLPSLSPTKNGKSFKLTGGFEIELVEVMGDLHMVHEKPKWFHYLVNTLEPAASEYCFFDSDITILNRMSFFGEWINEGVAMCEDINAHMPENHPVRLKWQGIAEQNGLECINKTSRYYNSGFLGWKKSDSQFIDDWLKCFNLLAVYSGDMKAFRVFDRTAIVLTANQDSLNVAYMTTNCKLSTLGPEAMGFIYGLELMAHPIGIKPWEQNYLFAFLKGKTPRAADLHFWRNVNSSELKPFSNIVVTYKLFICNLFRGLARIYSSKS